jgi:hypothetical protein
MQYTKATKIGLVLGSEGARGYAYFFLLNTAKIFPIKKKLRRFKEPQDLT